MNVLLATLLATMLSNSKSYESSHLSKNMYSSSCYKHIPQKHTAICNDAFYFATEFPYFTEKNCSNYSMIRPGNIPLNETEKESTAISYEAACIFQKLDCNDNQKISIDKKAVMNSLYKEIMKIEENQN